MTGRVETRSRTFNGCGEVGSNAQICVLIGDGPVRMPLAQPWEPVL